MSHSPRCPKCGKAKSKGEDAIKEYLDEHNADYKAQYSLKNRQKLDFYIRIGNKRIGLEYQGIFHYLPRSRGSKKTPRQSLKDNIRRDHTKRLKCKELGIKLYCIPYWDFHRIEKILDNILAGKRHRIAPISKAPAIVISSAPLREQLEGELGI